MRLGEGRVGDKFTGVLCSVTVRLVVKLEVLQTISRILHADGRGTLCPPCSVSLPHRQGGEAVPDPAGWAAGRVRLDSWVVR